MEKEDKGLVKYSILISALLGLVFCPLLYLVFRQLLLSSLGYLAGWGISSIKLMFFSSIMLSRIQSRKIDGWKRFSVLFYCATFIALGGLIFLGILAGKAFLAGIGAAVLSSTLAMGIWAVNRALRARNC